MSSPLSARCLLCRGCPGCVTACWGSSCPYLLPVPSLSAFLSSHMPSLQRIALEIPSTGYNGEEIGHFHFCICKSLSVLVWVTFYGLILYLMTSSATLNCLVWAHAFQMEVMGIDACSCWGHWQASASAGLVLGAVSQWLWLWPGAFGSASTLAPGLAVLRVWAWAVSTLLVLALKHFGTKLQRSLCNITHVLIF